MTSLGINTFKPSRVRLLLGHTVRQYGPVTYDHLAFRTHGAKDIIPSVEKGWNSKDRHTQYNASKLALMIEPRPMPHLVPLVLHMISVVPEDWPFLFIGSDWSVASLSRVHSIHYQQARGKLNLAVLPRPWIIENKEDVFQLLTDPRFYDMVIPRVEWLFRFEHDSILCANSEKSLNDWLTYSWTGAARDPKDDFPGPGGLSIRKISSMRRILSYQARYNNSEPEDIWFGKRLLASPIERVASGPEATFAIQDFYVDRPMGFHVPTGSIENNENLWKDPDRRKAIFEYCPEISMIIDAKLERERCPDDDMMGGRLARPLGDVFRAVEDTQRSREAQTVQAQVPGVPTDTPTEVRSRA